MFKHSLTCLAAAVIAGGLANGPAPTSAADDAVGIVQISDGTSPVTQSNVLPATMVSSTSGFHGDFYAADCPGYGYGACAGGCPTCPWPGSKFLFKPGSCTFSPDHGWAPPRKNPIRRAGVEYRAFWPHQWYGMNSAGTAAAGTTYPVIPMPTDTTQLGYYYQHVPQWRLNLAMIPPAPVPAQYHDRTCAPYGCRTTGSEWIPAGHSEVIPAPSDPGSVSPPVPPVPEDKTARRASYHPAPF